MFRSITQENTREERITTVCVLSINSIFGEIEIAALWGEYSEVDTTIPRINVIRRILEYYFMQLCGYDCVNISNRILEENRNSTIK